MKPEKRELSLYIHIPFCKTKCNYCDFLSFGGCGFREQKEYTDALCNEINAYSDFAKDYSVTSIFIGGGTPSYVEASFVVRIMDKIREVFFIEEHAEITLEGNPDSLTKDKLQAFRTCGINRLSIGVQSTNDAMLRVLGRVHNYDQFVAAYSNAREVGFDNINIDLMSGLPGEDMDSYIRTLGRVVELQPEHISAYGLIVEEGTPLSENEELLALLPSEDDDRKQYAKTKMLLGNCGYQRYEISNYAKAGYECRHNIGYWTGREYLGLGLGASSYLKVWTSETHMETIRFHGVDSLPEYVGRFLQVESMREDDYTNMFHVYEDMLFYDDSEDGCFSDEDIMSGETLVYEDETVSSHLKKYREYESSALLEFIRDYYKDLHFSKRKDEMEEFMFLGLRMMKGVSVLEFQDRFGVTIESIYGNVIEKYVGYGLLAVENDCIYLTDAGIDVSNTVMAEFML